MKIKYKNKNWLNNKYWNDEKSTVEIAKECNVSSTIIRYWMKKFKIPRRKEEGYYKKPRKECKNCRNKCKRPQAIYCSQKCQLEFQYKKYIRKWKCGEITGVNTNSMSSHIRRYLFQINNNSCQKCGWKKINIYSNKIPLTIHHIDGNYKNGKENNLELLCPNCHSLTENYGIYNKGKGRKNRPIARKHIA